MTRPGRRGMRCGVRACAACYRRRPGAAGPGQRGPDARRPGPAAHGRSPRADPPGEPGGRDWDRPGRSPATPGRARRRLRRAGRLTSDPGFLWLPIPVPSSPSARGCARRTADARSPRSSSACTAGTGAPRPGRPPACDAARCALLRYCGMRPARGEWPVRWAAWTGRGHRRLTGHNGRGVRGGGRAGPGTATSSSPAATTGRCGSGTRPPGTRSATRSPATPAWCTRWRSGGPGTGRDRLRQQRRDGAGLGRGHRAAGRRPAHRPHRRGERGGGGRAGGRT